ncbi:uncharacterized protein LOC121866577 isoform X1 [Homarus americanus]|uniref:uncharacterized protein LOC121866577 isoform X1 n=1 Tax=Homarus americanus TaxID=6706 RepID=UPI001C43BA21|nr:uncharacterized protein LOC121866577 isoform X1 [Homarus americanus]XP_042222282.1 uncharacterized protein LOC121866577 isoform X1 [Homarus americanus]
MDKDDNPEECNVCVTNYDRGKRRPRTLPCGHTFCSLCLADMIKKSHLSCPSCRVEHKAKSPTQFPISYAMEAVIRKLKILQLTAASAPTPTEDLLLLQEKEENINNLISGLQKTLSQMKKYESQLLDWKCQHEDLQAKIDILTEQNKAALKLLEGELSILLYQQKKGEEGIKRLQAMQESLVSANTSHKTVSDLDDHDGCNVKTEEWIQNCQKIFPDVNTVHTSVKVRENTKRALEMITETPGDDGTAVSLGDSTSIMEKVNQLAPILNVENLRRLTDPMKALLESGKVVAIKEDGGRLRSSRISVQRGKLHLHTLLDQPTPVQDNTLEHDALADLIHPSSTLVFLDFGWAGSTRGRVYIRLRPETGLSKQFRLVCMGQRGPTYANTRVLGVWNKGTEFEMVGGGDYDYNDGQGGTPLLQGLTNRVEYRRPARAGIVRALHGPESNKSVQYCITTRDCVNRDWYWAFGHVESGLDVVQAVANHKCIKEVTVMDCGIVLPL